ncbi:MAG: DNA-binding response regulator [Bacteroidota bacterium]
MKTKKILILEDEIMIAHHMQTILEDTGYAATRTNNVADFKEAYLKNLPHLAIIDINLNSKYEGITAGDWVKKKDEVPFIYLTSYADQKTIDRAIETRPKSYLIKPFKEKELLSNVAIIIQNHTYRTLEIPINATTGSISEVPYKLKKAIFFIDEHLESKINLAQLAEATGWSVAHFNKSFKDYLHISPYQYVLEKKMERAKKMVLNTAKPLREISMLLSFSSHSNFNKAFLKSFGITANELRKRKRLESGT